METQNDRQALQDKSEEAPASKYAGTTLLEWKDLTYSIPAKKAPSGEKIILHPQNGYVAPGDLLAIMGPSGSGKTSLLNALANRLPSSKGARCSGSIEVNGVPKSKLPCPFADISAYVEQEDALFALSTVEETLNFSAILRLPKKTSAEERNNRIEVVIRQLGLFNARHTNVGGNSFNGALRGLSGGERKRLSIAIELLHNPKCIFLDEPTTGLDSFMALSVVERLNELAKDLHTIAVSIHQPRSAIFAMFTGIYLLSAGKPVFAGDPEFAVKYFEECGFPLPLKFNPADFFIDLVSVNQRDEEQQAMTEARLATLHEKWETSANSMPERSNALTCKASWKQEGSNVQAILNARVENPAGQRLFVKPLYLLLIRGWREQMRDKIAIVLKCFFQAFFAFIFGLVYWQLETDQSSIQNRTGLIFFFTMNQAFGSVIGISQVIPRQLSVVQRERASRMYAISPYFVSNVIVSNFIESVPVALAATTIYWMSNLKGSFWIFIGILLLENICGVSMGLILSACFKSVTMAPQIAPAVVILFLLFSGFMINEASIPTSLIWLRETSFIRYAFKAAMVNEFDAATFTCEDATSEQPCIVSGNVVLAQLNFDADDEIMTCTIILIVLTVVFNIVAFGVLVLRRPSFLALQPPQTSTEASPPAQTSDKPVGFNEVVLDTTDGQKEKALDEAHI